MKKRSISYQDLLKTHLKNKEEALAYILEAYKESLDQSLESKELLAMSLKNVYESNLKKNDVLTSENKTDNFELIKQEIKKACEKNNKEKEKATFNLSKICLEKLDNIWIKFRKMPSKSKITKTDIVEFAILKMADYFVDEQINNQFERIKSKGKVKNCGMTFDVQLFEALERWRWENNLSRARAVNFILESFLFFR